VSALAETNQYHAIDRPAANANSPFVEVNGAEKVYHSARGPIRALADVTLTIRPGEFVSLLGPSGCGKSTLLRCIAGLEPITGGSIVVAGHNVNGPTDDVGVVFQRDLLLDWRTVLDNVLIAAQFRGHRKAEFADRARALLALFGIKGYERRYPWELSGGMRQRVSICRALLPNPKFLLLDEPFGALDEMTRDDLNVELQDRWFSDQKTVLFVTHSISEAVFLSDRVLIMSSNPGRIVDEVIVDLPRKRPLTIRDTPRFVEYTGRIRGVVASTKRATSHD
jgi:NitT/TauT family transport system ATP-binding protein